MELTKRGFLQKVAVVGALAAVPFAGLITAPETLNKALWFTGTDILYADQHIGWVSIMKVDGAFLNLLGKGDEITVYRDRDGERITQRHLIGKVFVNRAGIEEFQSTVLEG